MIGIGQVVSIDDEQNGGRIRAKIYSADNDINDINRIPYAYPLLPKMFHVKPKLNEAVLVLFEDDKNKNSQRYYIGPLISQPQFFEKQEYAGGATTLLRGAPFKPSAAIGMSAKGALPKDGDIAIMGRKNSDIILTDNDVRIRCGVHELDKQNVLFNTLNSAFVKLKYYPNGLSHETTEITTNGLISPKTEVIGSVANIVADKINLIGNNGTPFIKSNDVDEILSDEEMLKFLDKAHQLPYGDILCEFLTDFLNMFKSHTHNYNNMPTVSDDNMKRFNRKYGTTKEQIGNVLLSDSVRIN